MSSIKIIGQTGDYPKPEPWIFKPVRAFKLKLIVYYLILSIIGIGIGIALIIDISRSLWFDLRGKSWEIVFLTFAVLTFIIIGVLYVISINLYVKKFEYQVHGTEIIVKKGLLNITENHVPFSNITNLSFRFGLLDRLLGIGTIIVHTAGEKRGVNTKIKLEGIVIVKEVGYYILNEIKNVESFLQTLTLESFKKNEVLNNEFWNQFLEETSEIKYLLKKEKN